LYRFTNRVTSQGSDNNLAEFDPQPFQDLHLSTPGCTPGRKDRSACR
jgi:hypothetical protein